MAVKFRITFIFIGGLLAVFVLFNGAGAQEIDKERAISIVQIQGGPGGCTDEAGCSSFCENPDNFQTCIDWAKDNGLMSRDDAERAKKFAGQGRNFSGPGGCSSPEECRSFCENPENHDTCIDFAVGQGFMTSEEADRIREFRKEAERFRQESERERERFEKELNVDPEFDKEKAMQIVESQGGPGGCRSFKECEVFCENPQNQETCFEFAEKNGLFKNKEHARKIKKVLRDGGPGGCRGESQCRQFCENPENFEVCIDFAEKNEFIKPEEVEKAKKGIQALREGGPGGCRTPKECEEVCRTEANQDICFEWAKKHNLMSEEELKKIEEFKKRGEGLRKEFEQREFRPPEGFRPTETRLRTGPSPRPGEFLGPGGCVGAEECRKYCEDPAHQEECGNFGTPSGLKPPGFGGTPPPEYKQPEHNGEFPVPPAGFTPPPEYNYPQYTRPPQYTPPPEYNPEQYNTQPEYKKEESIIKESGAHVLESFKDFLR